MRRCRIDGIDLVTPKLTVGRGVLDTVPESHLAGAKIFMWDLANAYDPTEYVDGETVGVKITPVSGAGSVDVADAIEIPVTLDQRAWRPYPPGNLLIEGMSYEADAFYEGEISVAWAHRDRTQQTSGTLQDHFDGDIGPEAGTLYRLQGYIDGSLVYTEDDVAGTSTSWIPSDSGTVKIEVHSKRDGVYSWQAPSHQFLYSSTSIRITEADEVRYCENDDFRTSED